MASPSRKRQTLISRDEHNEARPPHRQAGGTKFSGTRERSSRGKKDEPPEDFTRIAYDDE